MLELKKKLPTAAAYFVVGEFRITELLDIANEAHASNSAEDADFL